MSQFEKQLNTCSQCKFCHQIEDYVEGERRTPRWICFANPPVWDGQFDPGRLTSWNQPQVYPNMPSCRFFQDWIKETNGF